MARRLDGVALAAAIRTELLPAVARFSAAAGRPPALHIVLAGDDPASEVYVRNKARAGHETGLAVVVHRRPAEVSTADLVALVSQLNADAACDGILVQAPLPPGVGKTGTTAIFDAIAPGKDVDGFHPQNVGKLVQGRAALMPCTPSGVLELLRREGVALDGARAVVIGRSEIVGKPMALLLLQESATVTICHSRTRGLRDIAREADVLVAAIGRPAFVTADFVKPGAVVIDVGISPVTDRALVASIFGASSPRLATLAARGSVIVGDVHPDVVSVAGALTPVPGGVGPLTIAMLLRNTLRAAEDRAAHHHGAPSAPA